MKHLNQADRWDLSQRTLERWRVIGWGPCFLKIGDRVIYCLEDVEAYECQHMRTSTSDPAHQPQAGGVA